MGRTKGTYTLTSNIEPKVGAPLDARTIVKLLADLTASNTFEYPYKGMKVFVEENNKSYTLVGSDPTVSTNWIEDNSGGHTIKNPAGTAMTQRSNLQFVDLTVSDDSTNDATKVESVHVIHLESELDNLPDGLYMLDEDEETVIDGNLVGYDNTDSGLISRNAQDAIDEVVDLIEHNEFGSYVDISSYGVNNKYSFPSDGYIFISGRNNTTGYIRVYTYGKTSNAINGGISINITDTQQMASLFVRKGMRCYVDTNITGTSIQFISLA